MDYLTPTKAYSRLSSHSASPRRRGRANSLTPPVQDLTEPSAPTPKRPPRPTTPLNELFRPRCNTDPSRQSRSNNNSNNSGNKKPTGTRSVLGSLLRQTFKVTSASVGFSASEERLTQLATTGSLSDNAKRRHSSFIERNNNNNNNNNNLHTNKNNKNAKISTVSAPASELLKSPDMEAFPDIASLMLADKPKKQTRLKKSKQAKVKTKSKAKTEQQLEEPEAESEQQLLRRHNVQEYEQLLQQLATLPRPQSLPAKVHFDLLPEPAAQQCQAQVVAAGPPNSKRSSSTHIKRESFLRQSLQSIRRSFSSNKQAGKLALPSPTASSNASSSASSSSTTSSCCSSTALTLLSKAQAHNHQLDQFLPTPVLLLLNNQLDADADADADTVDAYQSW
ncbi:maker358 [Drosophila busckii]|uniref:Maker358 n=1 Tax=Drosophila busckii TaxID=30019 RepID=A0A0M4FB98_DROBS|nr:maker358 [Drosophila busckii]